MATTWQNEYYRYRRYFFNIRQFYKKKQVRVYTEIVLYFLTTAFFLFFAIRPTALTISELIKKIKDQRLIAQKLGEKINALSLAQQEFRTIQGDLYLVDQALPKNSQISTLIKQIEFLGIRSNVTIEGIQYSSLPLRDKIQEGKKEEVNFKMVISGNYQDLKNFLLSLLNLRRIIIVDEFGFKTNKEGNLVLNIGSKAFFLEGEK